MDLRYITTETSRWAVSRYSGPNLLTTWGMIEKMRTFQRTRILQLVLGPGQLGHESAKQLAAVARQAHAFQPIGKSRQQDKAASSENNVWAD